MNSEYMHVIDNDFVVHVSLICNVQPYRAVCFFYNQSIAPWSVNLWTQIFHENKNHFLSITLDNH